jgi:hypothetical protein
VLEKVPDREVADFDATLGKLGYQSPQGDIRLLGQAGQQPVTLCGQSIGPMATHRARRGTPGRPEPLRPLHHTRNADPKRGRHLSAALPTNNCRNYTLPKVKRIRSSHELLASTPASILNQKLTDSGIPIRFS